MFQWSFWRLLETPDLEVDVHVVGQLSLSSRSREYSEEGRPPNLTKEEVEAETQKYTKYTVYN